MNQLVAGICEERIFHRLSPRFEVSIQHDRNLSCHIHIIHIANKVEWVAHIRFGKTGSEDSNLIPRFDRNSRNPFGLGRIFEIVQNERKALVDDRSQGWIDNGVCFT